MPSPVWANIKPATLAGDPTHSEEDGLGTEFRSLTMWFNVPLDHNSHIPKKTDTLTLHAKLVYARDVVQGGPSDNSLDVWAKDWTRYNWKRILRRRPFLLYLCGGPGDGNKHSRVPELNRFALEQGFQLLYVDYRGTGRSRPFIDHAHISTIGPLAADRAAYLSLFRQDNITRDLEAIRLCLSQIVSTDGGKKVKWTLLGQSFGGWIALTYLSFLPTSLAAVYMTAGLAPIGKTPHEVYARLYRRVAEGNEAYYCTFPGDVDLVWRVVDHLRRHEYPYSVEGVKGRHKLTAQTFMTLGRCFGAATASLAAGARPSAFDRVHTLIERMVGDIGGESKSLSEETVALYASMQTKAKGGGQSCQGFRLHERPLYGVLHEAIYCDAPGVVSGWAAEQVGLAYGGGGHEFSWLKSPTERLDHNHNHDHGPGGGGDRGRLFFSGEMIYPFMFRTEGPAVRAFQKAADILAERRDWPALYDEGQLARNKVPVRAVAYREDMYVDFDLSRETASKVRNCAFLEGKKGWGHGALKDQAKTLEVLEMLFGVDGCSPSASPPVGTNPEEDIDYPC